MLHSPVRSSPEWVACVTQMSSRHRHGSEALIILVIEDDPDARHIYSEYLRSKRWTVFSAIDGRMGLNKINELRPDVIVLDLAMPRVDGWTVLKNVRESSMTADIAIVVVSAMTDARDQAFSRRVRCLPHEALPTRSVVPADSRAVALPGRRGATRSLPVVDLNCQAGVVRSTIQDEAWAIVLAAANEAERAAEVNQVVAFAASTPVETDVASLRPVAVGDRDAAIEWRPRSGWELVLPVADVRHALIDLYLPICSATIASPITVGHLGQSLDGFIATHAGESQYVTGEENIRHLHRMRALCDAVVVGAGTVAADDPQLTTRHVSGPSPVRVVLDPTRRLADHYRVFNDDSADTLYVCGRS